MASDLDLLGMSAALPHGLAPEMDPGALITGRLLGLDPARGLAQVTFAGSDGVWVPATAAIYQPDGLVRLLRSPLDGGRITKCDGPVVPGQMIAAGTVVAVNASVGLLKVAALDGEYDLPYSPGTYSVNTPVHVLRSASQFGLPVFVLGPSGNAATTNPGQPGGGGGNTGQLVTKQTTILPTWSGSWRARYGRWDSWNPTRYGGRSTLWQGDAYGSGPMTGLAVYGDRIVNLRAVEILSIVTRVWMVYGSSSDPRAAVLRPSQNGAKPSGAASTGGATASSPGLRPNQVANVALPGSVLEGFRVGTYKGLATVGGDYAAFSGTPDREPVRADGMALTIQYRVRQ